MSLILSGTDGLSDVDGSAATPAIRGTDTNTGIFFPAADTIAFAEGGVESMRIDSAGNLGIGTTTPSNRVSIVTASGSDGIVSVKSPLTDTAGVVIDGGTSSNKGSVLKFSKNASVLWQMGTDSAIIGATSDNFHLYGGGANAILFSTNAAQRYVIGSAGQLGIGASPSYGTSGQVLTSGGSGAAPTWSTPSAGAMTLISTQTASSSATLDWTGLSGYNRYVLILDNILPATNNVTLVLRYGTGGTPTYKTTGYVYSVIYINSGGSFPVETTGNSNSDGWYLNTPASTFNISNSGTGGGLSGTVDLTTTVGTYPAYTAKTRYLASAANEVVLLGGNSNVTTTVTAFRLLFSSGNIASGTASLYGLSS